MALILSRHDIQKCVTMPEAIEAMRTAFRALAAKQAAMPQRLVVELAERGVALLMPSLLQTSEQKAFSLKVITVMPNNPSHKLPLMYATVLLLDAASGKTLAILEGGWLTAMRTGAVSGLATELLARKDADRLALFGAGVQAPTQVLAIHSVRPLREIRVSNRSDEHYQQLVTTLQELLGTACPVIERAGSSREALAGATLVACATSATAPLFQRSELEPGTHINAVGAFTPDMCEVDPETVAQARIVVDQREAALVEAGDLIQPLQAQRVGGPETWIELGELVNGSQQGRGHEDEITLFKSVGLGVQDLAMALQIYQRARESGIGIDVDI